MILFYSIDYIFVINLFYFKYWTILVIYQESVLILFLFFVMNRPLALVCYICGRQFGTKSLGIHIKSCQQKWENQQNLKPPKQRRPCPRPPPGLQELLAKDNITRQDISNFNNGSFNTFMEEALVECEYCGRKFNQKSLVPHQKACMKQPMVRKHYVKKQERQYGNSNVPLKINDNFQNIYQNSKFESSSQANQNLVPCRKCGRTFNPDRVAKHQKVCKQSRGPKQTKIEQKFHPVNSSIKPNLMKKKEPLNEKPAKWKIQHEEFQNALKAMKQIKQIQQKGGNIRDLPPPPPSNYDHYVPCKYCGRKYAAEVAERHIPKCANIINKPGGIQRSKIQQKYVANTGVKKMETPVMPTKSEVKSYQLTKQSYQKVQVQPTKYTPMKPNMKLTSSSTPYGMRKK